MATRCATEAFSTTCAVHIVGVGGCLDVVAQWQSTGGSSQVSWVWLPVAAGLFTFLYFRLVTSKFIYRHINICTVCGNAFLYKLHITQVSQHVCA